MPSGRLLSRTCKDQADVDQSLPIAIIATINMSIGLLAIVLNIALILPLFSIVIFFSLYLFYLVTLRYLNASRELKRLQSNSRSPILSMIGEAIDGQIYFRTYHNSMVYFKHKFDKYFNMHLKAIYSVFACVRYISVRTEVITSVLLGCTVFLVVFSKSLNYTTNAGLMGLCIAQMLKFT